ncbi:MAG: hypothetical protein CVV53_05390 [Spirochaetae bacterium HGW-Spirochaetae-9]|nr:MAG: hypothetical protein CVV53_05390 [Spirochaetae bacterium HGW-Spirochaetae-9]
MGVIVESLTEKAFRQILDMIVTFKLEPGQIVSENEISRTLDMGRMPIRDAFKRLESDGLVSVLPKKGVMICMAHAEELFLQLEVRRILEELIVRRACKYANPLEREKILELANSYEAATLDSDPVLAVHVDEEFHKLLGESAKNPFASKAISPFYARFQRVYFHDYTVNREQVLKNNYTHIDLMRSIASGDEEKAVASLRLMLKNLEDLVAGSMKSWLPEDSPTMPP